MLPQTSPATTGSKQRRGVVGADRGPEAGEREAPPIDSSSAAGGRIDDEEADEHDHDARPPGCEAARPGRPRGPQGSRYATTPFDQPHEHTDGCARASFADSHGIATAVATRNAVSPITMLALGSCRLAHHLRHGGVTSSVYRRRRACTRRRPPRRRRHQHNLLVATESRSRIVRPVPQAVVERQRQHDYEQSPTAPRRDAPERARGADLQQPPRL